MQATKHPKSPRERREINGISFKECKLTITTAENYHRNFEITPARNDGKEMTMTYKQQQRKHEHTN